MLRILVEVLKVWCELTTICGVEMYFFSLMDEHAGFEKTFLVLCSKEDKFKHLRKLYEEHIPSVYCSAVIRKGHPFITVDFLVGGFFKLALPLDEVFESGETLGDKLKVGDVLTVILTNHSQDELITISKKKPSFNLPLKEVLAFSFRYAEEMAEIYASYKLLQRVQSTKTKA